MAHTSLHMREPVVTFNSATAEWVEIKISVTGLAWCPCVTYHHNKTYDMEYSIDHYLFYFSSSLRGWHVTTERQWLLREPFS